MLYAYEAHGGDHEQRNFEKRFQATAMPTTILLIQVFGQCFILRAGKEKICRRIPFKPLRCNQFFFQSPACSNLLEATFIHYYNILR